MLEVCVGGRAQPIVGRGERLCHHVARPRVVEPGQQDERAEPDVAVRIAGDGVEQRRNRSLHGYAPDGPRGRRPGGVIDGRELVDCRLQLFGGDGSLTLFRRSRGSRRTRGLSGRRGGQQGDAHDHDAEYAHVSQSIDLRASCRYACSLRGNATGYTPV